MAILAKKYEVVDVRGVEHLWQYSQPFPNLQLYIVSVVSTNRTKSKTRLIKRKEEQTLPSGMLAPIL
jgi:hypothetical protein